MDKCPHCGGDSGHRHVLVVHYVMGGPWGQDATTTGDEWSRRRPKTVRCFDCNRRVKFEEACGDKPIPPAEKGE